MGSCANCGATFFQGGEKVDHINSTWLTSLPSKVEQSPPDPVLVLIPVGQALSVVFETAPLNRSHPPEDPATMVLGDLDEDSVFKEPSPGQDLPTFVLCRLCGENLDLLYNSFQAFTHLSQLEGEIAKRLLDLENLKGGGLASQPKPPPKKPRGRLKANKVVKPEVGLGTDVTLEEDEGLPSYYFPGSVSSPPDSPIMAQELAEPPRPRSPRPVRKSSSRNKNWAKLYKEEDSDEESKPTEETEVIMTPDLADVELPTDTKKETPTSASSVSQDEDYIPEDENEDEDDEDYKPEQDLEEILSQAKKGPGLSEGKRNSRLKSISRSIRSIRTNKKAISGNFECECGRFFAQRKGLQRHQLLNHKEDGSDAHQCLTCTKIFTRDDHLRRHRRDIHGETLPPPRRSCAGDENPDRLPKKITCPVCEESYLRKHIQAHVGVHGVPEPWKCSDCPSPMTFALYCDYTKHKSTRHRERKLVPANCPVCSKTFRSSYHLKRHQGSVHHVRSNVPVVPCSSSSEGSGDEEGTVPPEEDQETQFMDEQGNLIISIKPQGPLKKKSGKCRKHKCEECGKRYTREEKLVEHLVSHGIGERYKCPVCDREFNHIRSQQRHMLLHSENNPFQCETAGCDKAFSRKDHLIRHLFTTHGIDYYGPPANDQPATSGQAEVSKTKGPSRGPKGRLEKMLKCPHCEKVVKRERLRLHMVIHTGEKRHMCDHCGQKFGLRTTLLTHIQCVHQGVRRYSCSYCSLAFKRSNHLKDHEKLHTDADSKPFPCQICGKGFRREKNLKSHMICHGGAKDYMCEICGKAFNRIDNMRAHVKTVHQGLCIRKKKPRLQQHGPRAAARAQTQLNSQNLALAESSSPPGVLTRRKGARKRQRILHKEGLEELTIPTTTQEILLEEAPGTTVLVAVESSGLDDPSQFQGEESSNQTSSSSYDALGGVPTTTIVQLAPNQTIIPQNSQQPFQGNFTTFYQYTYF